MASIGDGRRTLAAFAHEMAHAHRHHGLQLLPQSSAMGALLRFYIGDISSLLAAASAAAVLAWHLPSLDQQAGDYAAALRVHNGMSPGLLPYALKKLTAPHPGLTQARYLPSHPWTEQRTRRLRALAASFTAK